MTTATTAVEPAPRRSFQDKLLDGIEKVGNKVPHPVLMFLYLIAIIMVLSHVFYLMGVSVTEDIAIPVPIQMLRNLQGALGGSIVAYDVYTSQPAYIPEFIIQEQTIPVQSLLTVPGLRFVFSSFVANFVGGIVTLLSDTTITIDFGAGGQLNGNGGCNTFFGSFQVDGNNVTIVAPASASALCVEPEGIMEQETAFLNALQASATYRITGDTLELITAGGQIAVLATRIP